MGCFVPREGLVVGVPLHDDVRRPERCLPAGLSAGRRDGCLGLRAKVRSAVGHYGLGKNAVPEISPKEKRQHHLPKRARAWKVSGSN